jgi:hypothetical protein
MFIINKFSNTETKQTKIISIVIEDKIHPQAIKLNTSMFLKDVRKILENKIIS